VILYQYSFCVMIVCVFDVLFRPVLVVDVQSVTCQRSLHQRVHQVWYRNPALPHPLPHNYM